MLHGEAKSVIGVTQSSLRELRAARGPPQGDHYRDAFTQRIVNDTYIQVTKRIKRPSELLIRQLWKNFNGVPSELLIRHQ